MSKQDNIAESTLEKSKTIIKGLKGVLNVYELSNDDIKTLKEMELGHKFDLIPVKNKGLEECFNREYSLVIFKDSNFRNATVPTVLLVTDKNRILGQELISPREKKMYQDRGDVYFLSEDFILFKPDKTFDRVLNEKEFFLLPPVPFPELEGLSDVFNVVSCSPSANGDIYLKTKHNYPQNPSIASIIVSYSVK